MDHDNEGEPLPNSVTLAKRYVDRLHALAVEKNDLTTEMAEVKAKAKADGLSPKALMVVVARMLETPEQKDQRETVEEEAELIMVNLGMLADTPLGRAAQAA